MQYTNNASAEVYTSPETMDAITVDEAQAILQAKQGDPEAFGRLVNAYQRKAYAVAYGFVGNREDALELAQEAFARAYKAMERFDTSMPFYPWIYRILKNVCLNHLKKRKRHGESSLDGMCETGYDVPDRQEDPEQSASRQELQRAIAAAMEHLAPAHREILFLRHFQDLPYAEIATCLGVPVGTVMSRLHAARRALRDQLEGSL